MPLKPRLRRPPKPLRLRPKLDPRIVKASSRSLKKGGCDAFVAGTYGAKFWAKFVLNPKRHLRLTHVRLAEVAKGVPPSG
jgi:hypothetical protein